MVTRQELALEKTSGVESEIKSTAFTKALKRMKGLF
jgi:hypothetical protein